METYEAIKTKYSKLSEEDLLSVIVKLVTENANLKTLLFCSGRERMAKDPVGMKLMFDQDESALDIAETPPENQSNEPAGPPKPTSNKKKRGKRKPLPAHLARIRHEIDLAEDGKICKIHLTSLVKIGEDIVEKLEIMPPEVHVLQHVTLKYKCPCCDYSFHSAKREPDPKPKSFASPSLLAYIATAKFVDGLPLYRQERIFDRFGIDLNRTTMARWMIKMGNLASPLSRLLLDDLLESPVIHMDETEVQVICEEGQPAQARSYMWCIGRQTDKLIIVFNYEPSRSRAAAFNLVDSYTGTIVCDGYKVYDSLAILLNCTIAGCFAHMRRKFWQAEKIARKEAKSGTAIMATRALVFIKKIYAIEAGIKAKPPDEILKVRQELTAPLLDALFAWLKNAETPVLSQSLSVTSLRSSYGPIRHPDVVRLISWLSYRVYLLLRFLVGTTRASPVAWCILAAMLSLSPRRGTTTYQSLFHSCCSAFAAIQAVRPPVFDVSRLSLRSLLLRPGRSLTVQMTALLMSFRKLGFPPFCHSSYVVVILATAGFSPLNTPAFAGHTESASTPTK